MELDSKPHLRIDQQIEQLEGRGLVIDDPELAANLFYNYNYYRLRGYFHVFLANKAAEPSGHASSDFAPGVSVSDIHSLVVFDHELRHALLRILAEFEIQFRARYAYHAGSLDKFLHENLEPHLKTPQELEKLASFPAWLQKYKQREIDAEKAEVFIGWNLQKYGGKVPVWAAVEVMDFGGLTKLYGMTPTNVRREVADTYGLGPSALTNWLAVLGELRNIAAHHGRTWNRKFVKSPRVRANSLPPELQHLVDVPNQLYRRLAFLRWLDQTRLCVTDAVASLDQILSGFPQHPLLSLQQMGYPRDANALDPWADRTRHETFEPIPAPRRSASGIG